MYKWKAIKPEGEFIKAIYIQNPNPPLPPNQKFAMDPTARDSQTKSCHTKLQVLMVIQLKSGYAFAHYSYKSNFKGCAF